jgi:hypothetical protein
MVPVPAPYCGKLPPLHQKNKVISLEKEIRNPPFPFPGLKTEKSQPSNAAMLRAKAFTDTT